VVHQYFPFLSILNNKREKRGTNCRHRRKSSEENYCRASGSYFVMAGVHALVSPKVSEPIHALSEELLPAARISVRVDERSSTHLFGLPK
jgi:hypothetical protein